MSDHKTVVTTDGGIETALRFDEAGNRLIVTNIADAQGLIDQNTAMRNEGVGQGKEMKLAARIPVHMVYELEALWKSLGLDTKKQWKKWLNDPDMAAFRTNSDRI